MPSKLQNRQTIIASLELWERFGKVAKRMGKSRSFIVRRLIEWFIANPEERMPS